MDWLLILEKYGLPTLAVIALGLAMWKMIQSQDANNKKLIDQLILINKPVAGTDSGLLKELKTQTEVSVKINALLEALSIKLDADRIYVFLYHNGGKTIVGPPWLNQSWWAGIVRNGVPSFVEKMQRIPVTLTPWWSQKMAQHEFVSIPSVVQMEATERFILIERGAQSVVAIGLYDSSGNLVGYLGMEWCQKSYGITPLDEVELRRVAAQTEILLGMLNLPLETKE